jgi:nitrate/TMAO reductase-like tetraheme cytochrome c subunit
MFKRIFDWCKRHIVLFTLFSVIFIVVFGFINIQILHMTSEPEFCHLCHPAKGFGPLAEVDSWEHSAHGEAGVSCLDCHGRPGVFGYAKAKIGGLKDTYMQFTISREEKLEILSNPENLVPDWQCLYCHSDEGNQIVRETTKGPMKLVKMRMLDDVVNPTFRKHKGLPDIMTESFVGGTQFDHAMHIESFELACNDCHFGVVHNPGTKTDRMNFCLACHVEFEDDAPQMSDCDSCHQAQFEMNTGEGAIAVEGIQSMMYGEEVGMSCLDCHTGINMGLYRPTSSTCTDCHEDDAYLEIFEEWAAETERRIEMLKLQRVEIEAELIDADIAKRDTAEAWETYENAVYNLKFVRHDGTHGVHNNEYAAAILDKVEEDFNKTLEQLDQVW